MTRDELLALITELQEHRSCELPNVELKAAHEGTPKALHETMSSFANGTGGVMIFGVDEMHGYKIVGVHDPQRLQADIATTASDMEPAVRPEFTVEKFDEGTVVAAEIEEIDPELKPCYHKPAGFQKGSFIRVGNSDRHMTDYEIFGYVSARTQPEFDKEPVREATLDDLDEERVKDYVERVRRGRPNTRLAGDLPQALKHLNVLREIDGVLLPTLAGMLVFGKDPQHFEPQLVITFLQFFGTGYEKGPRGERFMDNRKFEGPLPQMVDDTVNYVISRLAKSSLIEGLFRRDIPEYPEEAVREAVVNAVAHRDYSHFVRGSYIQIRLFADRLEVQSPGGLYGKVTVDTLDEESSTRNRVLMRILEDLHVVENRGSGIRSMVEAMRSASLGPPVFDDRRASFWVIFRSHTLMGPQEVAWLNQFAALPLNDRQRVALVCLRLNDRITNSDYRRLNSVDVTTATRELRQLVEAGLAVQHSTKRWAYYTPGEKLRAKAAAPALPPVKPQTDEERILAYVREKGSITRRGLRRRPRPEARREQGEVPVVQADKESAASHDGRTPKRSVRLALTCFLALGFIRELSQNITEYHRIALNSTKSQANAINL